jgi:hypothetical protein
MFEGFRLSTIDTAQASIRVRHGGSGQAHSVPGARPVGPQGIP